MMQALGDYLPEWFAGDRELLVSHLLTPTSDGSAPAPNDGSRDAFEFKWGEVRSYAQRVRHLQ